MTEPDDTELFDHWMQLEDEERQRQEQRRRVLDRIAAHLSAGFDELHEMGETDYLLSIAKWLNEKYGPGRPGRPQRGHRRRLLFTDPEYSRVFWQWLKAPRGKKQAILKCEYERLGYTEWEHLQTRCLRDKKDYPEGTGALVFGEALAIHNRSEED